MEKGCPQPRGSFFEVARPYATCKFCSYSKCKLFRGKQPHIRSPLGCISGKNRKKKPYMLQRGRWSSACLLPFGLWVATLVLCSFLPCFTVRLYQQWAQEAKPQTYQILSNTLHNKESIQFIIFSQRNWGTISASEYVYQNKVGKISTTAYLAYGIKDVGTRSQAPNLS